MIKSGYNVFIQITSEITNVDSLYEDTIVGEIITGAAVIISPTIGHGSEEGEWAREQVSQYLRKL